MLVIPLLDITEENTVRFSISHDAHPTWQRNKMADALNAFLHFSFLESGRKLVFSDLQGERIGDFSTIAYYLPQGIMHDDGKCILYDPQLSTLASVGGPWDRGVYGLRAFERDHKCSKFCRILGIDCLKKEQVLPPRPRPKPRVTGAADADEPNEQTKELADASGLACIDPALLRLVQAPCAATDANEARKEEIDNVEE